MPWEHSQDVLAKNQLIDTRQEPSGTVRQSAQPFHTSHLPDFQKMVGPVHKPECRDTNQQSRLHKHVNMR